jgi:hypothetical protein
MELVAKVRRDFATGNFVTSLRAGTLDSAIGAFV